MIESIRYRIKTITTKIRWRKCNIHNHTSAANLFDISRVSVGRHTYGPIRVFNWGTKADLIIGDFCSIAQEVTFLLSSEHFTNHFSSFPFKTEVLGGPSESFTRGNIIIDDDVWLGYRSTVLSGVHIGQGAIIAAGSVVTKDVPPYAIVGGVPARVIKYRFEKPVIEHMLSIDYRLMTDEMIKTHIDELYRDLDCVSLDELRVLYKWAPKR